MNEVHASIFQTFNYLIIHHHESGWEDQSGNFFFSKNSKCWLYLDFFTIFLFHWPAILWDEIWFRSNFGIEFRAWSKKLPNLGFMMTKLFLGSSLGMLTVTCEFKLGLTGRCFDLTYANAAHTSSIRNFTSHSVNPTKESRNLKSSTLWDIKGTNWRLI